MGIISKGLAGTGLLFGGLLVLGMASDPGQKATAQSSVAPTVIPESFRLADNLDIQVQGKSSRLSSVAVLSFKVQNKSDIHLKDASILCEFYGSSGTKLGEARRTAYREFLARKTTAIREMNFGFVHQEAKSVSCRVTSAERASPV